MLILAAFVVLIDAIVTLVENRLLAWRPGPSTSART
jgi:NitT/TauT family transport system permease protein